VLAALALAPASPARAEIKQEIRGQEILVTNVPAPVLTPRPLEAQAAIPAAPIDLGDLVSGSAARYGFDPAFVQAVVAAESAFDQRAVSKAGARGLMQLMPDTARRFGIKDVHDPATNLDAGVAFLRELVSRFAGDVTLALAAYNAGPESVARYGGVPPYEETRAYLARIRSYYGDDLQRADRASGAGTIRLAKVEPGGVPCYTNLRPRRNVKVITAESRGGRP